MKRIGRIIIPIVVLSLSAAHALDLPFDISLEFGFNARVMPAPDDQSRNLGLWVHVDEVFNDKIRTLVVSGTITNFGDAARRCVDMRFVVTHYIDTGKSRGRAVVEPDTIPPGGTASFKAIIHLDSERPRNALYTVTAQAAPVCFSEPNPDAIVAPAPEEAHEIP